jgi:hypothetical protein
MEFVPVGYHYQVKLLEIVNAKPFKNVLARLYNFGRLQQYPGANPKTANYNASPVKIYNAASSLVLFKSIKYIFLL